jgi:cellobiose epimerase
VGPGGDYLYRLTGERVYFTCFTETLGWIVDHQADWEHGDWHARIAEDGRPFGDKAGAGWKGPYHNGRALIRCLELLAEVPGG